MFEELQTLNNLRKQGFLTEEEFAIEKAKILGREKQKNAVETKPATVAAPPTPVVPLAIVEPPSIPSASVAVAQAATPTQFSKPIYIVGGSILALVFLIMCYIIYQQQQQNTLAEQEKATMRVDSIAKADHQISIVQAKLDSVAAEKDKNTPKPPSEIPTSLYITGTNVNVRSSPDISSNIVMQIAKFQTQVAYLKQEQIDSRGVVWYNIFYAGKEGWVSNKFTSFKPFVQGDWKKADIIDSDAFTYVREASNGTSTILAQVRKGERFTIINRDSDWWLVILKDETRGYMHYSRIDEN
jgi:uncharacterized protein YgiM (DUF1202 family)